MSQDIVEAELIELLVRQETLVSELYSAYSRSFPTYQSFWMELAQEELKHADWLKRLYARSQTGTGSVIIERIDVATLETNVATIEDRLAQCKRPDLQMAEALSTALELEASVCESEYFQVFEGDSEWAEFKQVQYCLAEATRHHVEKIHTLMAKGC